MNTAMKVEVTEENQKNYLNKQSEHRLFEGYKQSKTKNVTFNYVDNIVLKQNTIYSDSFKRENYNYPQIRIKHKDGDSTIIDSGTVNVEKNDS